MDSSRGPVDDKFAPVTAADVTDERLLVGEFRAFRNETRSAFELLTNKLVPLMERLDTRLDDHDGQIAELKREVAALRDSTDQRLAALEGGRRKGKRK